MTKKCALIALCILTCTAHNAYGMEKKQLAFKKDPLFVRIQEILSVSDDIMQNCYTETYQKAQTRLNDDIVESTNGVMSDIEGRTAPYFFETFVLQHINLELISNAISRHDFKNKLNIYAYIKILKKNGDYNKLLHKGSRKAYLLLPGLQKTFAQKIETIINNYNEEPPLKECLQ